MVSESAPPEVVETLAGDGAPLAYYEWRPEPARFSSPRGWIQIVHGFGEHQRRYDWLARQFTAAGYVVGGVDHRGMGRSGGERAFIHDFEEYVHDLRRGRARLQREAPGGAPGLIYAHSMGGLVALRYAQTYAEDAVSGVILSGPLTGLAFPVPGWQQTLGRLVVPLHPRFAMPAAIRADLLTHAPERQRMIAEDPLALPFVTVGWFFAAQRAMAAAHQEARRVVWPTLWLIAGDDRVCSAEASRSLFRALPNTRPHTWNEYPGLYHELHQERQSDRMQVATDALEWLMAQPTGF